MESNGESNRIQVSQSTAELIVQSGKGYVIPHLFMDFHLSIVSHRLMQLTESLLL